MIDSLVHPLLYPLLSIAMWLIGVGALFAAMLGLLRRSDKATYRNDWLRLGIMIGLGLVLVIAGAFGRWVLLPFLIVIAVLGWRELVHCVEAKYGRIPLFGLYPALGALSILGGLTGTLFWAFFGVGVAMWAAVTLPMILTGRPVPMQAMLGAGLGMMLLGVPLSHLLLLVNLDYGAFAFLIVLINCHDGFAVGFGRLLGRRPLCIQISPKKTWEGAVGALVVCLVIGYAARFLVPDWASWQVAAGSVLVAVLALLGDLVASSLKREANIKDFSQTLPGMGGLLDRFDGLLFIAPMFYVFVVLIG